VIQDGFPVQPPRGCRSRFRRPAGFSLIELLLVMVIIIILVTLYFGSSAKSWQVKQIAACAKNLDNVYVALTTSANDNNGRFPSLTNAETSEQVLSELIPRYTTGTEYFTCPGSKDDRLPDAEPFAKRRISYAYYMGHVVADGPGQPLLSDRQVNTNQKYPGQALFSTDGNKPGANHNKYGGNVTFCDGNTQSSGPLAAFTLTNNPGIILLNPKP
jgi:prepilin-type N-terminal cleavage/methylation domain-containing protein/prepilin-type processing-associated H-X9-DG protein